MQSIPVTHRVSMTSGLIRALKQWHRRRPSEKWEPTACISDTASLLLTHPCPCLYLSLVFMLVWSLYHPGPSSVVSSVHCLYLCYISRLHIHSRPNNQSFCTRGNHKQTTTQQRHARLLSRKPVRDVLFVALVPQIQHCWKQYQQFLFNTGSKKPSSITPTVECVSDN